MLGRQIIDNILVDYELLHYLRRKTKGKKWYLSIKLDMSKAYNHFEWTYLERIIKRLDFRSQFISLVMNCVSSTSFSILVNGITMGHFLPTRDLRQRNPLSPYLFLLYTKGLASHLESEVGGSKINRIRLCRRAPKVNHLLFMNDSIIFSKVDMPT